MIDESISGFRRELEQEVIGNILSCWMKHAIDDRNGGFIGFAGRDWEPDYGAHKAGILNTRILWTFSRAFRAFSRAEYLAVADRAFSYISEKFWDSVNGGIYWDLSAEGEPETVKKQVYAQAFAIYALSEYYSASGDAAAIDRAKILFILLERNCLDILHGGYMEACTRDWKPIGDMRLSAIDMNAPKSMNTHLHVLEAYANLCRIWNDPIPLQALKKLVRIIIDRILDPETAHFRLFFDLNWKPMSSCISYGHDIEGSWLLYEAAAVTGDADLASEAREVSIRMARAVLDEGVMPDGSIAPEADGAGYRSGERDWWPQAEGVVGFYNAFQLTGDRKFRDAALGCWEFIKRFIIDTEYGEWIWGVDGNGAVYRDEKLGPWKCPYHNSRTCFEILERTEYHE